MAHERDVVLAFSGGLDTSFCVPWLRERDYRVTTLFVDTGGTDDEERNAIEARAHELGVHQHITQDASDELWDSFVIPFVMGGERYQQQYPLLCSDRYVIAKRMVELAREMGTPFVAHGCTAAGNDQFRFDQSLRSLGDVNILAPIREIQSETTSLRSYEEAWLRERGFGVRTQYRKYTINENILGTTVSGSEIDAFAAPSHDTWRMVRPRAEWPAKELEVKITFEEGVAVALNDERMRGPQLLQALNTLCGKYGIGRGIYTGDTTIGLKGRIVFEAPGLTALLAAHRALEEITLTKHQNAFKPVVARRWTELVYEGFFYEPLRHDLEAMITSTQDHVTGTVTLASEGASVNAVAVQSDHMLHDREASYAQGARWSGEEAVGFIRLYGQSSRMAADRERRNASAPAGSVQHA
ncbi:MAG: argininosuccinate synthase [Phycisphaerales bacterium]